MLADKESDEADIATVDSVDHASAANEDQLAGVADAVPASSQHVCVMCYSL